MSRQIQVLHAVSKMTHGGVESWLMNVWRHVDRDRFRFTFCILTNQPGDFDAEIVSLGGRLVYCPVRAGYRSFARQFKAALEETCCDALHSHVLFLSGWLLKLGSQAGVRVRIGHAHSTADGCPDSARRSLYRWLMRRYIRQYATHGVGCSAAAADYLFTPAWRTRPDYQVLPCAIDTSAFRNSVSRASLCQAFQIPSDATIIGHVGNFRYAKNHAFLLAITAEMVHRRKNVHLLLVGGGSLMEEMGALAARLGIDRHVTFAGPRDDVPVLMRSLFDLMLFPSHYEGLGLVVVEAQCAGVPCLISDVIPEEADVVDQLIHRESLRAGPDLWAERALQIVDRPTVDKDYALRQVERSPFNIGAGVRRLSELYSNEEAPMSGLVP